MFRLARGKKDVPSETRDIELQTAELNREASWIALMKERVMLMKERVGLTKERVVLAAAILVIINPVVGPCVKYVLGDRAPNVQPQATSITIQNMLLAAPTTQSPSTPAPAPHEPSGTGESIRYDFSRFSF